MSSPLPIDWPELKEQRAEKDDYACIECGAQRQLYIGIDKMPDECESPDKAWQVSNLMTLCTDHIVEGGKVEETKLKDTFGVTNDSDTSTGFDSIPPSNDNEDSLGGMATFDVDEEDENETSSGFDTTESESSETEDTPTIDPFDKLDDSGSEYDDVSEENTVGSVDGTTDTTTHQTGDTTTSSDQFGSFTPPKKSGTVLSNDSSSIRPTIRSMKRLGIRSYLSHLAPTIETGQSRWDGVYRFGENRLYTDTMVKVIVAVLISLIGWVAYNVTVGGETLGTLPNPVQEITSVHHAIAIGGVVFAVTYFLSMVLRVVANSDSERYQSRWVSSHLYALYGMGASVLGGLVGVQMVLDPSAGAITLFVGNIVYMGAIYGMMTTVNALLAEEARKNVPVSGGWVFEYIIRVGGVFGVMEVLTGSVDVVWGVSASVVAVVIPVVTAMVYIAGILSIRMRS